MVFTIVREPIDRFTEKFVVDPSGCWLWTSGHNGKGYPRFWYGPDGGQGYGHRWSYEYHVGPVPEGMELDHLCQRPSCVNPLHLEPVTPDENKRRASERRTECPHGHAWDLENTRWYRGHRRCRACDRIAQRAKYLRAS